MSQRALAAFNAISLRFAGVRLAARFFPPIFPPLRPRADITREISEALGCSRSVDAVN